MTDRRRPGARRQVSAFHILVILIGTFLLYLVLPNLGPVIQAARAGAGVQGTFTAERLNCVQHPGHTACNWEGGFRSEDGTVTRADVFLYGGSDGLSKGTSTRARDVGRAGQVYRPAGSHEWIVSALVAVAGVALILKGGLYGAVRSVFARKPQRPTGPPRRTAPTAAGSGAGRNAPS